MRTKVLEYGSTEPNKIVCHNRDLEQVAEGVYTHLYEKSEYSEDSDQLCVVLKIGDVYFEEGVYRRQTLRQNDLGKIGTEYIANYRDKVEDDMQNDRHVSAMTVRVFEELGWDSTSLEQYRQVWAVRKEVERKQQEREKILVAEQAAKEAAEKERLRLEKVKADFIAGTNIAPADFMVLCKSAGIVVPLRTHGTMNKLVCVNFNGTVSYYRQKGKRKPDVTGCQKLILDYAKIITNTIESTITS
jgi:hypothetical protein